MAHVEEEVGGALAVPVLDDLGQRELQNLLVEADGALDVRADQGDVVNAASTADRPPVNQVRVAELGSPRLQRVQVQRVVRHVGLSRSGIPASVPMSGRPLRGWLAY